MSQGIFGDLELSCDWQAYRPDPVTSPHVEFGKLNVIEITVCDAIRNPKNPNRNGQIVQDWKQEIIHDPTSGVVYGEPFVNEAHSLIKGRKKKAVIDAIIENSKLRPN
ncbi:hypothetical protein [Leptospira meyeri]|uniref:hypothetical protein n=1 Tax=Leptospira meyeri TaxID=29508 RepID=UPI001082E4A1|nr:hypothetical protein [Leptospira meyeri]TGM22014.1 hypothetical protein EHQ73_09470 [Leptospira meyeri]